MSSATFVCVFHKVRGRVRPHSWVCSVIFVGVFGHCRGWFRSRSWVISFTFVGVFGHLRGHDPWLGVVQSAFKQMPPRVPLDPGSAPGGGPNVRLTPGDCRGCVRSRTWVCSVTFVGLFGHVRGCVYSLWWVVTVTFKVTAPGSVAVKALSSKCHPVHPWIRDLPQEEVPTCGYRPVTFVGVFGIFLGCFQ